jgi:hypothetical protein
VRQEEEHPIPFITDQRGMPDDLSPEMQEMHNPDSSDLHSHTWMTLKEVLNWPHWDDLYKQKIATFDVGTKLRESMKTHTIRDWCSSFWKVSIPKLKKLKKNPKDVRLLMWFDN